MTATASPKTAVSQAHPSTHWPSVLQFAGSALGLLLAWSIALATAFYGLFQFIPGQSDPANITASFLTAVSAFFGGLALLPSAALSLGRLVNRPYPDGKEPAGLVKSLPPLALPLLPLAILLGSLAAQSESLAWLLLPILHVLTVSLLLVGLLWLGLRRLRTGPLQRLLAAFSAGLTLSPVFAFILEAVAAILLVMLGFLYLSTQPQLLNHLEGLLVPAGSGLLNSNRALDALELLLDDPFILTLLLVYLSLVVPLIEELLKPIAVWLLLGRNLTSAQGFALGVLGGAGFALFENLTLGATSVDWTLTNVLRIGATALHMATGGLMGCAIVRSKNEKRYWGLFGTYLASVFLHGLWNAMAVVFTRESLTAFTGGLSAPLARPPLLVLGLLSVVCFALLIVNNRQLRREQTQLPAD